MRSFFVCADSEHAARKFIMAILACSSGVAGTREFMTLANAERCMRAMPLGCKTYQIWCVRVGMDGDTVDAMPIHWSAAHL